MKKLSEENNISQDDKIKLQKIIQSKLTDKLKIEIRERDNHTCQECNKKRVKYSKKLDIHHIDYNKENNKNNNLITLCNKCHTKTNIQNKEFWYVHFVNKLNTEDHWLKVTWEDACTYSNESIGTMKEKESELVDTFGKIVLYNIKHCIIMTHDSRGESNDYIKIPISLVRKIEI